MICPKCGSDRVNVQSEQISSKTKKRGTGCLWRIVRCILIICTCGLWLLIGRRKGTEKTKIESRTVAICQNCGNRWEV